VFVGPPPAGTTPLIVGLPVGISVTPLPFIGRAFAPVVSSRSIAVRLLSAPAPADIAITVTSSNPTVAAVATPARIRAGDQVAELSIVTGTAGSATLRLEGAGVAFEFTIVVGSDPAAGNTPINAAPAVGVVVIANPAMARVTVSPASPASATLGVRLLSAPQAADLQVTVTTSNADIATLDGSTTKAFTIPAGQQVLEVPVATTGTEGSASLTFEFQGQRRELLVVVGNPPLNQLPAITAPIVGIEIR